MAGPRKYRGRHVGPLFREVQGWGARRITGSFLFRRNLGDPAQYLLDGVPVGTKVNVWFNHVVLEGALRELARDFEWISKRAALRTAEEGIPIARKIVEEMGLVASGLLRDSFVAKYTAKGAELENTAPYAYFVHYGTGIQATGSAGLSFYLPNIESIREWIYFKFRRVVSYWEARRVAEHIQFEGTPATRFMDRIRDVLAPFYPLNILLEFESAWVGGGAGGGGSRGPIATINAGARRGGNRPRRLIRGPRQRRGPGGHMGPGAGGSPGGNSGGG